MDKIYNIANWIGSKIGLRGDYILHFGVCSLSTSSPCWAGRIKKEAGLIHQISEDVKILVEEKLPPKFKMHKS